MMKKFTCLFLFLSFLGNAEQNDTMYKFGNDTFEIKYKVKDVTTTSGSMDLVLYSIFKNGKFIHSDKDDGGRLFGCKYKSPKIMPINTTDRQIGWMLVVGGICGNTFSYKVELIVPVESYEPKYYAKTFSSKDLPILEPSKDKLSILYFEQNWGRGGTSTSFYVPNKIEFNLKDDYPRIKKGNVLTSINTLEKYNSEQSMLSFLGIFIAGIRDVNPELMQYALDKYYSDDQKDWISIHFEKSDKSTFQKLIQQVRVTQNLLEQVKGLTTIENGS